jgi:hypothetical protein
MVFVERIRSARLSKDWPSAVQGGLHVKERRVRWSESPQRVKEKKGAPSASGKVALVALKIVDFYQEYVPTEQLNCFRIMGPLMRAFFD